MLAIMMNKLTQIKLFCFPI